MTPPRRPDVIVFGVVGTLADLTPVRERITEVPKLSSRSLGLLHQASTAAN